MQTHKKDSSRTHPDQRLSDATGQTVLSTVEPLSYGTSHVVSKVSLWPLYPYYESPARMTPHVAI